MAVPQAVQESAKIVRELDGVIRRLSRMESDPATTDPERVDLLRAKILLSGIRDRHRILLGHARPVRKPLARAPEEDCHAHLF